MLVIRLSRTGRTKRPHYRVVVAEKSAPVKGRFLEVLGHYDPRTKALEINVEAAQKRIAAGAQPSETAGALLEKAGVLKRAKLTTKNRRPAKQTKNPSEEVAAPAAAAESSDEPAAETTEGPGETVPNPPDTTEESDTSREDDTTPASDDTASEASADGAQPDSADPVETTDETKA